ncbi:MAG: IclR family transcriptional regulator [Trueperaceae bacterium]
MSSSSEPAAAKTVDAALTLLEEVATQRGATLSDLARATGMTTSKAFRLLGTLERRGYLERRSGKAFELGSKVLHLGHRAARGHPLVRAAAPVLDRLAERFGETVLLAVRVDLERVIVDSRDAKYGPQLSWPYDARLPLNSGALGLCLLAYAPEHVLRDLLAAGTTAFTDHTVVGAGDIGRALEAIRREHVYVAKHSYLEGVYSVGSPVLGPDRNAIASLSVVGTVARLGPAEEDETRTEVRDAAAEIARVLA